MATSRKGKKASRNFMIKKFERMIDDKIAHCPFDERTDMFLKLEKWAKTELNEECCDIFLTALYNAQSTQDIQLTIGLESWQDT